jgi:hypothetical protein
MRNISNYITTAGNSTYGWMVAASASTSTAEAICELPLSVYQCPPSPPPMPSPPSFDAYYCE